MTFSGRYAPGNDKNPSIFEVLRGAPVTAAILVAFIALFALAETHGDTRTAETLIRFGGNGRSLIWSGQWWRLFTGLFLHMSLFHLVCNVAYLYVLGVPTEQTLGAAKFGLVFVVTGVVASAVSVLGQDVVNAGASGAGFGVLGAWLVLRFRALGSVRALAGDPLIRQRVWMNAIWIVLGFTLLPLDNYAHLGGLAAGIVLTLVIPGSPASLSYRMRWPVFAALACVTAMSLVPLPWADRTHEAWTKAQAAFQSGDLDAVIRLGTENEDNASWQRGVRPWTATAFLNKGDGAHARAEAEKVIADGHADAQTYYVLGYACRQLEDRKCEFDAFVAATRSFPENKEAWTWLADAQLEAGFPKLTLESLEHAGGGGDPTFVRRLKLQALAGAGRYDEAAQLLPEYVRDGHEDAIWWQCVILARTDPTRARDACEACVQKFPEYLSARTERARLAIARKDFAAAFKDLDVAAASKDASEAAVALAIRAYAQLIRGDFEAARRDSEDALAKWPRYPFARAVQGLAALHDPQPGVSERDVDAMLADVSPDEKRALDEVMAAWRRRAGAKSYTPPTHPARSTPSLPSR